MLLAYVSMVVTACTDQPLAVELEPPDRSNTYQLAPLVVDGGSTCSDPSWWRDANGQCWPPGPSDPGGNGPPPGGEPGGGPGGDPPSDPNSDPFEEGPLAWAACILTFAGATMSVSQVGELFGAWYQTSKDLDAVERILLMEPMDHATRIAYQLERDRLLERYSDLRSQVHLMTGASLAALGLAALACSPAALLPLP
jgi:hypothetical protein